MSEEERVIEPFREEDLERTFIRANDGYGHWGPVNLREATDKQFDDWVRIRIIVFREDIEWTMEDRVAILREIQKTHTIYMLKKEEN